VYARVLVRSKPSVNVQGKGSPLTQLSVSGSESDESEHRPVNSKVVSLIIFLFYFASRRCFRLASICFRDAPTSYIVFVLLCQLAAAEDSAAGARLASKASLGSNADFLRMALEVIYAYISIYTYMYERLYLPIYMYQYISIDMKHTAV